MGVLHDIWRLMRAGARQRQRIDLAEAPRYSADAAEYRLRADPSGPVGDPFANTIFHRAGIPASGMVVSVTPSGADFAGTPVYEVVLEVRIDGREPYRTTYRTVIAAAAMGDWQPGSVLPFRVSPDDPHALILG